MVLHEPNKHVLKCLSVDVCFFMSYGKDMTVETTLPIQVPALPCVVKEWVEEVCMHNEFVCNAWKESSSFDKFMDVKCSSDFQLE